MGRATLSPPRRRLAKRVVRIICRVAVLPLVAAWRVTGNREVFAASGQVLSQVPGLLGSYMRATFYSMSCDDVSDDACIGFGTVFPHPEISIGQGVYIGGYCIIGMADLEDHVTIGSMVNILSGSKQHRFDAIDVPIQSQGGAFEKVRIGRNCWIGNGAVVLSHLGVQNIVGAGAVVTKPTGDYEILVGNPAKCIRKLVES